jgi:sterol 14-demethylase
VEINTVLTAEEALGQAKINQLDYIAWAIDETTRIRPSADLQMRTVEESLNMGSYQLPRGWWMIVNAANSHFMADVFSDPQRFDPLRWSPERGKRKNPFSSVGFGGSVHKCMRMNFAKNEKEVITALPFQQFELALRSHEVHIVYGNGTNPPSQVRVAYRLKATA